MIYLEKFSRLSENFKRKNLPHQVIGFHFAWKLDYLRVTIAQPVKCAVSRGLRS